MFPSLLCCLSGLIGMLLMTYMLWFPILHEPHNAIKQEVYIIFSFFVFSIFFTSASQDNKAK
jgi:hypothetical protein